MTYKPHMRLTLSGTLPDGEIFSNSLSLVPDNSLWSTLAENANMFLYLREHIFDTGWFEDIVEDCEGYWGRANSGICPQAVLRKVSVVGIDDQGHYIDAPREVLVNVPGAADASRILPFQISHKVTLETDGDLGRVKGGWYIPLPSGTGWDSTTNLWSVAECTARRDSVQTFINDLNNSDGFDGAGAVSVVVASQGRHNKNGTVRKGPDNYEVKRVNIGRRVDVLRSRANKLSEARFADAVVST